MTAALHGQHSGADAIILETHVVDCYSLTNQPPVPLE